MTSEEFVKAFYELKEEYKTEIFISADKLYSATLFEKLNLNKEQLETFKEFVDVAFTDLLYTILLSFDGSSSFTDNYEQQEFEIFDKNGNQICGKKGVGEIGNLAYEYFYENEQ